MKVFYWGFVEQDPGCCRNNTEQYNVVDNRVLVLFIFFSHIKLTRNNISIEHICSSVSHCWLDIRLCIHMRIALNFPWKLRLFRLKQRWDVLFGLEGSAGI